MYVILQKTLWSLLQQYMRHLVFQTPSSAFRTRCCSVPRTSSAPSRSAKSNLRLLPQVRPTLYLHNLVSFYLTFLHVYFPRVRRQAAPRYTPRLQTARTGRRIEARRSDAGARLPSSGPQISRRPGRTGSPTPAMICAWSASGRGSPW